MAKTDSLIDKSTYDYEPEYIKQVAEYALCASSLLFFLTHYVFILTRTNPPRKTKWQEWDYLVELTKLFSEHPEIVICKARQLGISWLLAAYGLWKALFNQGANILLMSGNESKAWDLLSKCRFIYDNLPDFMRPKLLHAGMGWLALENNSEIKAIASTERAGAGTDATLVIRDELREHPCGHENYVAISPCIDSGGQLVDLSTYDKYTPFDKNHFAQRVEKGKKGAERHNIIDGMEFYDGVEHSKLVFLGWKLRPVRMESLTLEQWWEREVLPKYSPQDREQEYPASLDEALRPPETTSFFDVQSVNDMLLNVIPHLPDVREVNTRNGMVKIWSKPVTGTKYCIYSDPSDGMEDPFVIVVMEKNTGEWVAIARGFVKADVAAEIHDSLVRYYNDAYNSYEANAQSGGKFGMTLDKLDTPHQAPRRDPKGKIILVKGVSVRGIFIAGSEFKRLMLDDYEEAIRANLIRVHDREAINEHRAFIKDDNGRLRASSGHDDYVTAGAGAWYLQKYIPMVKGEMKSYSYL